MWMRDYVRGAFQALAWVRMILSNVKDMAALEKTLSEIDQALEKIKSTAARDFTIDIEAELKTQ
jgi:hypothetical protein